MYDNVYYSWLHDCIDRNLLSLSSKWCHMIFSMFVSCSDLGYVATQAVPALEQVNPSWGAPPVDCDDERPSPRPVKGCVTNEVACGDVIEGTTIGGVNTFGDTFYQQAMCTPQRNDYERSPEAIYKLRLDGNVKAVIRLDSNCEDLDHFAIAWEGARCPTEKHAQSVHECEMSDYPEGGKQLVVTTVDKPQTYLVGVDGKYGAAANFRLTIECYLYR